MSAYGVLAFTIFFLSFPIVSLIAFFCATLRPRLSAARREQKRVVTHFSARPFTIKGLQQDWANIWPNFTDKGVGRVAEVGISADGLCGWWGVMMVSSPRTTHCRITQTNAQCLKLSIEGKKGDEEEEVGCHSAAPLLFFLPPLRLAPRHPPPPAGRVWPQRNPVTSRARPLLWRRQWRQPKGEGVTSAHHVLPI